RLEPRPGSHAEMARELAYRLYTLCERKKRAGGAVVQRTRAELAGDPASGTRQQQASRRAARTVRAGGLDHADREHGDPQLPPIPLRRAEGSRPAGRLRRRERIGEVHALRPLRLPEGRTDTERRAG